MGREGEREMRKLYFALDTLLTIPTTTSRTARPISRIFNDMFSVSFLIVLKVSLTYL